MSVYGLGELPIDFSPRERKCLNCGKDLNWEDEVDDGDDNYSYTCSRCGIDEGMTPNSQREREKAFEETCKMFNGR